MASPAFAQGPSPVPDKNAIPDKVLDALRDSGPTAQDDDDDGGETQTFVVDKDRAQCPNADFQSIQQAVAAAPPRSKILVCPDIYSPPTEPLTGITVPKTLTLQAVRRVEEDDDEVEFDAADPAESCFSTSAPNPTRDAIVTGTNLGFNLTGNEVVIDGFVAERNSSSAIITMGSSSRNRIRDNLVQDNPFTGVWLFPGGGSQSRVEDNCARSRAGSQQFGLPAEEPDSRVLDNTVLRSGLTGINGDFGSGIVIEDNDVRQSRFDYVALQAPGIRAKDNRSTMASVNGFYLQGIPNGLVRENRVRDAGNAGVRFVPGGNTNVTADDNDIRGTRAGDGIQASNLISSLLVDNTIRGNLRDGIRIEAGANAGNRIVENELGPNNREHDCHDDTVGAGTGGTANFWRDNDPKSVMPDNRGGAICPRDDDDDDDDGDDDD